MAVAGRIDPSHTQERVSSEILDRLPPQNLDAERAVLGSLILDPHFCDDVMLILRSEDFYADAHRKLFAHVVAMHDAGKRIDPTLLVERLKQAGDFEAVGGAAYIAEVVQAVPVAAHAVHYAQIVREKATLRALIHATTEILRDAYDPVLEAKDLVNQAEERIFAVNDERRSDSVTNVHDLMMEAFVQIDARLTAGGATGIPTGYVDLDRLTGGLHDGELVILASRPGMGKTALATNIADHVAVESKVTTLFVSLEMSRLELAQRMLCARGKIDGRKFRSGRLSGEDRDTLVKASAQLSKAALFVDDTATRFVADIAACARRLKRKSNLGLLVIDYLQLIQADNAKDPRQEQVAKITRQLKHLARNVKIPVLCLAQLNRQVEAFKETARPKLSHLRESGAIEQDADVVMFIHRDEYGLSREEAKEKDVLGKAELIVAKQRNGPVGEVKLHWFEQYTRFEPVSARQYDESEQFQDADKDF
jgi:replicative DNA helicase